MRKSIFKSVKTIVSFLLCLCMSACFVSCGGSEDSNTTVIKIVVGDNAYGTDLLEAQATRFSELHASDSYADGKTGVKIEIETSGSAINIDESLLSEGHHIIYSGDGYTKVSTAASNGWIANINDVLTTKIESDGKSIADKIPEYIRYNYYLDSADEANRQSGYYGIPNYEAYGGLTYDKDLFDRDGYYFANESATDAQSYQSEILGQGYSYKFTADPEYKTVGPDGIAGTEDDGLPSSLYELIVLCEKLKNDGVFPFIMSGKMGFYVNYFTEALYVSLLGYENGRALKDFKSDGVDVVVGYTNEDMFPGTKGLEGVKKPITQRVTIDEQYGYYMSNTVEKYYTFAFMQLMEQNEWYASASNSPNKGAADTQLDFLFGIHENARQGAMLIENSYWVNESRIRDNFKDYGVRYGKSAYPTREYRWMSLPVNVMTSVDGTDKTVDTGINSESKKGEPVTLYIPDGGYICVNARFENDTEIMSAVKDWFLFYCSDAELSWLSSNGCYGLMLDYKVKDSDTANASSYAKSFNALLKTANKVYPYGISTVYKNNYSKLGKQGGSASYLFGGGSLGTTNVREYLRSKENTGNPVLKCFEEKMLSIVDWNGYFGSNAQVPEAQKYPEGHPKAGQDIKYEGDNYTAN